MSKSTTIPKKSYTRLSLAEREEIAIAREKGHSMRSIATSLGRDPSTVSREIGRNAPPVNKVAYRANRAQQRAENRSRLSHAKKRLANPPVRAYVEHHLVHDDWTPESIAGRLSLDFPELKTNYESIYQWIYKDRRDLVKYLVRGHKKRHTRPSGKKSRAAGIPNRVDITQRPAGIDLRKRAGHWEVDAVISRQSKTCVAILVERKTRFFIVLRIEDKTAAAMSEAVTRALIGLPPELRKTLDTAWKTPCMILRTLSLARSHFFANRITAGKKGA